MSDDPPPYGPQWTSLAPAPVQSVTNLVTAGNVIAPPCREQEAYDAGRLAGFEEGLAATPPALDPWATDLTLAEITRLARAISNADHMNWPSMVVAQKIAGTVRAIAAARLSPTGDET